MTLSSLRTILRVKLYTAISLMIDIADITEMPPLPQPRNIRSSPSSVLPLSIAQLEIPLQRLPGTAVVLYQSAIALKIAARTGHSPHVIAEQICRVWDTSIRSPRAISLETNATGWLTLSMSRTDVTDFLDQSLCTDHSPKALCPKNLPFGIWHTYQRCQSLRSHLAQHPQSSQAESFPDLTVLAAHDAFLEALLDCMDKQEATPRRSEPSTVSKSLYHLCQSFDRLHQQVPLFHPKTSREIQLKFLQSTAWMQGAIECAVLEQANPTESETTR